MSTAMLVLTCACATAVLATGVTVALLRQHVQTRRSRSVIALVDKAVAEQWKKEGERTGLAPYDPSQRVVATFQRYTRYAREQNVPIPSDLMERLRRRLRVKP